MKKILAIIMVIAMMLCVEACSNTAGEWIDSTTKTWTPGELLDSAYDYVYTASADDFEAKDGYDYLLISDEEYFGEFTIQGDIYIEYLEIYLPNATVNIASDVCADYIEATSGEHTFIMYGKATDLSVLGGNFVLCESAEVDCVYIDSDFSSVDSVEIYSSTNLAINTPTKLTVGSGASVDLTATTAVFLYAEENSITNLNYSESDGETSNDTATYILLCEGDEYSGTVNIDTSSSIQELPKVSEDIWEDSMNAYSMSQELSSMAFDKIIGGALDAVIKAQGE